MKSAEEYIESSELRELVKMKSQIADIDFTEIEKDVAKINEEGNPCSNHCKKKPDAG